MRMLTRPSAAPKKTDDVHCGDYYHSDHHLYRVEHAHGDRILVEDCASEELFELPASDLRRLIPTHPQESAPS